MREQIKELKEKQGITYKHIATVCGIPYISFIKYITGERDLPQKYHQVLGDYLTQFRR